MQVHWKGCCSKGKYCNPNKLRNRVSNLAVSGFLQNLINFRSLRRRAKLLFGLGTNGRAELRVAAAEALKRVWRGPVSRDYEVAANSSPGYAPTGNYAQGN